MDIEKTSILKSINKALGIHEEDDTFDDDIMMHINSVFAVLHQIGASPPDGFFITDGTEVWSDFLQGKQNVQMVKTYIYDRVRLIFDPPANSSVTASVEKRIAEFEWRLNVLELTFNPYAHDIATRKGAFFWRVREGEDFPPEAEIGDLGLDPDTSKIWRNT
jgi:hypothetical protein